MEHIHIGRGTTNLGSFREDEVRQGLVTGRFFPTDLGWREGMEKWQPLSQFPELAQPAAAEPPPIPGELLGSDLVPTNDSPMPPAVPAGLPWDERQALGVFNAWLATLKMVLLDPTRAFAAMRREGGIGEPIFYALIGGTIGGVMSAIYQGTMQAFQQSGSASAAQTPAMLIGICIFLPVFITLGLFISAGLIHLSLMVLGAARQPFETTFRTVCFGTGSTSFLQIVPFCGSIAAAVWNLVVVVIGLTKTHGITTGKAVVAVMLPTIVCCGLISLALAALISGAAAAGLH